MWKANQKGIVVLLAGLLLLGVVHVVVTPHSESLADQILALGFCLLLFSVGLVSWYSVRPPEVEDDAAEAPEEDEVEGDREEEEK